MTLPPHYKTLLLACGSLLLGACHGDDNDASPATAYGQCTTQPEQNQSLYNYLSEAYLWYANLPQDFDPAQYASMNEAMVALRDEQDRFSYTQTKQQAIEYFSEAKSVGYGLSVAIAQDYSALVVNYVYADSTAGRLGLTRGARITHINGTSISDWAVQFGSDTTRWNALWQQGSPEIDWLDTQGVSHEGTLTRDTINLNTVLDSQIFTTAAGTTGYLVFDSFRETSASELAEAFRQFSEAGVSELILDLRYNGGGLDVIAQQLASQIGGDKVLGQVLVNYQYNDKRSPQTSAMTFALTDDLARLDLTRLIVLTSHRTYSASELTINGLKPYLQVVQIGEATGGKPYGMDIANVCDNAVFAITTRESNAEGMSDYDDGLPPDCAVTPAVVGDWGDPRDPLLGAGLYYLNNGACPATQSSLANRSTRPATDRLLTNPDHPWEEQGWW